MIGLRGICKGLSGRRLCRYIRDLAGLRISELGSVHRGLKTPPELLKRSAIQIQKRDGTHPFGSWPQDRPVSDLALSDARNSTAGKLTETCIECLAPTISKVPNVSKNANKLPSQQATYVGIISPHLNPPLTKEKAKIPCKLRLSSSDSLYPMKTEYSYTRQPRIQAVIQRIASAPTRPPCDQAARAKARFNPSQWRGRTPFSQCKDRPQVGKARD